MADKPVFTSQLTGAFPFQSSGLIGVPIGTILPYVGPKDDNILGDQWAWCDGRAFHSPGHPLDGQNLPLLNDETILIGVEADQKVNVKEGTNEWANDGSHDHNISVSDTRIGGYAPGRGFKADGDGLANHDHPLRQGNAGGHNHGEKLPKRYGVRFIIRVK